MTIRLGDIDKLFTPPQVDALTEAVPVDVCEELAEVTQLGGSHEREYPKITVSAATEGCGRDLASGSLPPGRAKCATAPPAWIRCGMLDAWYRKGEELARGLVGSRGRAFTQTGPATTEHVDRMDMLNQQPPRNSACPPEFTGK